MAEQVQMIFNQAVVSRHPRLRLSGADLVIGTIIRQYSTKRAVPVTVLMETVRLSDPVVRGIVRDLVIIHGLPIGSNAGNKNPGYYWINCISDLETASQKLITRGIKTIARGSKLFKRNADEIAGQLQAVLGE